MLDTDSVVEISQTLKRFFRLLDQARYDDLLGLMRTDATWLRQGRMLDGADDIRRALAARPATQVIRHVVTNIVVDAARSDAATATACMTAYRFDDGASADLPATIAGPLRLGDVHARFTRATEGWRIAELSIVAVFEIAATGSQAAA